MVPSVAWQLEDGAHVFSMKVKTFGEMEELQQEGLLGDGQDEMYKNSSNIIWTLLHSS